MSVNEVPGLLRDHSSRIGTAGIVLALLHLGRSVLIPLALAIMLSLLVAPLVRALRRLRVGRISSVLVAVVALVVLCTGVAAALDTQFVRIADGPSQYESNVQHKLKTLEEVTTGPLRRLTDETSRLIGIRDSEEALLVRARDAERSPPTAVPGVAVLEPPDFGSHPLQLMGRQGLLQATRIRVFCPGVAASSECSESGSAEPTAGSLGEAVQICMSWREARSKPRSQRVDTHVTAIDS